MSKKSKLAVVTCAVCKKVIPKARLEAVPGTPHCVKCAEKNPEPLRHDPNSVCSTGSASGRNGFARND